SLVSASNTPRSAASAAALAYTASVTSRRRAAASYPIVCATCSKVTFSSCSPTSALVAGVKIGSGSWAASCSPSGSSTPQTAPVARYSANPEPVRYPRATHSTGYISSAADHRAPGHLLRHVEGDHVVGHQWGELFEPPQAQRGEHRSLVRDRGGQHVVISDDAVRGDHQDQILGAVVGHVQIAHLAGIFVPP